MIGWKVVINIDCVIFTISEGHELKYYVNTDVLPPPPPHMPCHAIFQAVSCWLLTAKTWFRPMLVHMGLWWNKWQWGRIVSEHSVFSLSVSFQPCCIPIRSHKLVQKPHLQLQYQWCELHLTPPTSSHHNRKYVMYFWPMVIKACVGVMCFMAVGEWGCADSGGDGAQWGAFTTATDRDGRDKPQF